MHHFAKTPKLQSAVLSDKLTPGKFSSRPAPLVAEIKRDPIRGQQRTNDFRTLKERFLRIDRYLTLLTNSLLISRFILRANDIH